MPQGIAFVPLDSRASSRMTARGAVSRQKKRGRREGVRLRAVILAEVSRPAFGGTTGFGGNPVKKSIVFRFTPVLQLSESKLENDGEVSMPQVLAFVPLDSRASSRMTARGAVSRQKKRGRREGVRLRAVILAEVSRPAFGGTTGFGGNPVKKSIVFRFTPVLQLSESKLENDGAGRRRPGNDGAEASGFDADGKIYRLDSRASSRMTARGTVGRAMTARQREASPLSSPLAPSYRLSLLSIILCSAVSQ